MDTVFQIIGSNFVLVFAMMLLLWVVYFFRKNGGIVDIGWGIGFIITIWVSFVLGDGLFWRRILIGVLVTTWASRLTCHIWRRFMRTPEDPRYQRLRENFGSDRINIKFLMLFLFQGFLIVFLSIPFYVISLNERNGSWIEGVGVLVWLIGFVGETLSDEQLRRFKSCHPQKESVCQTGFWKVSRHPNYFFECVVWVGYFLMAFPGPGGWLAIISPVIMYFLLTKVSGIPLSEAESIRSKGEAYEAYQKTTSSFFPWFRLK